MTDFLALRYAVGHALPRLAWRHHGIGCLQAYLHEGESEVRVHIWHPDLIKPAFDQKNGAAHNHRFGFTSRILLGRLYNERIALTPTTDGDWQTYVVENARAAKERAGVFDGACIPQPERYSVIRSGEWLQAGDGYEMAPRDFHYSKAPDLCVTLITKTTVVDGSARILCRADRPLVHAFDGTEDFQRHAHLMAEASRLLTDAVDALAALREEGKVM